MNWKEYLEFDLLYWSWIGTSLLSLNFAIIGTTLVEKKLTLIADTFSHAILPGVVLATLVFGSSPFALLFGGWVSGFFLMAATLFISKKRLVYQDSVFAFLSLFFVAIGMIISFKTKTSPEILHLLFGQVLSFDKISVLLTLVLTLLTFTFFYFGRRLWSLWVVDPQFLENQSLPPRTQKVLLFISLSLLITSLTFGLNSLGAFMTVGLVVVPALISQQLFDRLYARIIGSGFLGLVASFAGFILSIALEWPLGPSVVVVLSCLYLFVLIFKPLPVVQ
jgi:zinc/manganese transport system permease protein